MSPSATSIIPAAKALIFCAACAAARCTDEPAFTAVRAANEPTPSPVAAVSAGGNVVVSGGEPEKTAAESGGGGFCALGPRGGPGEKLSLPPGRHPPDG